MSCVCVSCQNHIVYVLWVGFMLYVYYINSMLCVCHVANLYCMLYVYVTLCVCIRSCVYTALCVHCGSAFSLRLGWGLAHTSCAYQHSSLAVF